LVKSRRVLLSRFVPTSLCLLALVVEVVLVFRSPLVALLRLLFLAVVAYLGSPICAFVLLALVD